MIHPSRLDPTIALMLAASVTPATCVECHSSLPAYYLPVIINLNRHYFNFVSVIHHLLR